MNKTKEIAVLKKVKEIFNRDYNFKTVYLGKKHSKTELNTKICYGNDEFILLYFENININFLKMFKMKNKQNTIIATGYVNKILGEELKNNGIYFADTAGNVFIKTDKIFIYVIGKKPENNKNLMNFNRIFTPAAIRLIYFFLKNPFAINNTYRDIAEETGIALGGISDIIKKLKKKNFIIEIKDKQKRIIRKEELFQRWCENYIEILLPKLIIGRFKGKYNWRDFKGLDYLNAQWGGEPAAFILTKRIKPEELIIYANREECIEVIEKNMLLRNGEGNVILIEKFWKNDENRNLTADPMIIYADLIANGNQRNLEAAKEIYETRIVQHFREN